MFCKNCGKQISDNAKFCSHCGAEQSDTNYTTNELPVQETHSGSANEIPKSSFGFLKFIIKLALIIGLVLFAFINYRIFSFDKGWVDVSINGRENISAVSLINSIPTKIEYYKKTIKNNEYDYKIYIETSKDNYLFDATEKDIQALDILGLFATNIKPQKVTPIPFYVEIIIGFLIIIIPFGRRKVKQE